MGQEINATACQQTLSKCATRQTFLRDLATEDLVISWLQTYLLAGKLHTSMASAPETQRASRYHNQSGVEISTVDFAGVGGIAALDPALPQVPTSAVCWLVVEPLHPAQIGQRLALCLLLELEFAYVTLQLAAWVCRRHPP